MIHSSFEAINVVYFAKPEGCISCTKIFFWVAESVPEAAAVNTNGNKTFFANGLSTFFIKGKPVFSNGLRSLPKSPPNCAF